MSPRERTQRKTQSGDEFWAERAETVAAFRDGTDVVPTFLTSLEEVKPYDHTGAIIAFEAGELSVDDTVILFQHLIDTGLAWQLQGHYGRTAKGLIDAGRCRVAGVLPPSDVVRS